VVYASRGVTFFVRDDDWTVPRLVAYAPASVEESVENLGARDKMRYFDRDGAAPAPSYRSAPSP
jgi:hypothetical protein